MSKPFCTHGWLEGDCPYCEVKELKLQVEQARKTAEYWKANHLAGNEKIKELEERYGIYAQHLKSCVVFIAPEIPCDCGFLTTTEKRKSVRERAEELGIDTSKINRQDPHPPGPYPEEGGLER